MSLEFRIQFDPKFIEESVFLIAHQYEKKGKIEIIKAWNAKREKIYEITDIANRENSFARFYEKTFLEWGVPFFFEAMIGNFPILKREAPTVLVQRVLSRKDEGSELYSKAGRKTILILIQTIRLMDLDYLEKFLKHEFLRMSDILDPAFNYSHDAVFGTGDDVEDNLIRDRYRILWDLFITSRLLVKGFKILMPLEKQTVLLDKAFLKWPVEIREKIFLEIQNRPQWTQAELLRLAEEKCHDFARA